MEKNKRPVIGISCGLDNDTGRVYLARAYIEAVQGAGGLAVLLPPLGGRNLVKELLDGLHGMILSGGTDLDPLLFNQEPLPGQGEIVPERDRFEIEICRLAMRRNLPVLAICRGVQVLNVAAGGSIYQDLASQVPGCHKHNQQAPRWYPTHSVEIMPGTKLQELLPGKTWRVNSFHHQAVEVPAAGFSISARAGDGVVEAVESSNHPFLLGIQWHPEYLWRYEKAFLRLFHGLVTAARDYMFIF